MSKILVIIGAPGAGKGTQSGLLQKRRGIPQISTGDMFREMKNTDTPLAREVQEIMASGKLINDELTYKIVKERTNREDCQGDYILDGYPRTAVQAEQLEGLANEQGKSIHAILVNVPLDELEKRLTGRRNCPVCGEIYNIYFKQPNVKGFCDFHPTEKLDIRADDDVKKVKTRLSVYDEQTKPLLEYYEKSGRLQTIDGTGELEEIYQSLNKLI